MKRSCLSTLFSDDAKLQGEAVRDGVKRAKQGEEEALRALVAGSVQEALQAVTVKGPCNVEKRLRKAARKLSREGLLVIRGPKPMTDFQEIVRSCLDLEMRVCKRLTFLGLKFSGFDRMSKSERSESERLQSFRFKEVSSRCLGRLDMKLPNLQHLNDSACPWYPVVRAVLGPECILSYAGLISSFPSSWNQPWHGDGPHLFGNDLQLPPHALNVFIALQDVTEELGPTEFFPGSNQLDAAERLSSCLAHFTSPTQATTLDAADKCRAIGHVPIKPLLGTADSLIYDYRTVHRGTSNCSSKTVRRVLYLLYTKHWFSEGKINFGEKSLFDSDNACLAALAEQQREASGDLDVGHCHFDTMR